MKKRRLIIILVLLVIVLPVGVTFSRYITESIKNYIMEANNFYFNSDKLVYGGTTYGINNWGGVGNIEIQIQLNNHKNNILTSDSDIAYTLTTSCDASAVICTLDSNSGVIYRDEKTDNLVLTVNPRRAFNDGESITVGVSATSSSPYVKTLSATFIITVGTRGINYEIRDSVGSPYFLFTITNAQDTYKVITAFNGHQVGELLTTSQYLALSAQDKQNCASALITLTFNPGTVILDTTSDIMKTASYTTSVYDGINYINSITFKVDVLSSTEIRFYKRNSSANYTYPITNPTSIVTFTAV